MVKNLFYERRLSARMALKEPLAFKSYASSDRADYQPTPAAGEALSRDISLTGLCFQAESAPPLSSVVWMSLDPKITASIRICQDVPKRTLQVHKGLLGQVVHVERDASGGPSKDPRYNVGVSFIQQFNACLR